MDVTCMEPGRASGATEATEDAESEPPRGIVLDIVGGDETVWAGVTDAPGLARRAAAALARHALVAPGLPAEACVALSDDATVRQLNRDHRGQDKPTNVLSFPAPVPPQGRTGGLDATGATTPFLGDVVLAGETLATEAATLAIPPAHHLQHLVVHGLLHLLGHDHETDAQARVMEGIEIEVLAALGVPDPYVAAAGDEAPTA